MTKGLDRILEGQGDQPGGSQVIAFPPRATNDFDLQNSSTIARVFGDAGDAQSWVVTLGVITGPVPYDALPTRGSIAFQGERAVLRWGLDGAVFDAELDWRPCSFVVRGAYVEVSARSPNVLTGQSYRYTASICPAEVNAMGSMLPGGPTRTIFTAAVAGGGSTSISVPLRARAVRFYNNFGGAVPNVDVLQLEALGSPTIVAVHERISTIGGVGTGGTGGALPQSEWLPLVWCTRALTLVNPSPVSTSQWSCEFLIDVG